MKKIKALSLIVALAMVFWGGDRSTVTTHLVCNDGGRVYHCEYEPGADVRPMPLHQAPSPETLDFIFQ